MIGENNRILSVSKEATEKGYILDVLEELSQRCWLKFRNDLLIPSLKARRSRNPNASQYLKTLQYLPISSSRIPRFPISLSIISVDFFFVNQTPWIAPKTSHPSINTETSPSRGKYHQPNPTPCCGGHLQQEPLQPTEGRIR